LAEELDRFERRTNLTEKAKGDKGLMNDANKKKPGWKKKLVHEAIEYWINFIYLAVFFGMFTWYRRLILAEYQISYFNYGAGLVEAAVLAKVIMIGDIMRLGRRLEEKSLIFQTVYKAVVFSVWVGVFAVLEHTISGFLHGKGLAAGFHELMSKGKDELLARCLVTFFAFVPFFAFKELGQVLGEGKIRALFFRRRAPAESDPSRSKTD
jgi:hypothetical protein